MSAIYTTALALLVGIASVTALQPADPVPAFSVQLMDEPRVFSEADLPGGYTLVFFWSTTCGPCIREMSNLHAAHEHFDRLEIISISRDEDQEAVQEFRRTRYPMPWLNAWVGNPNEVFDAFGVRGTPHLVLVGPEGNVVARTKDLLGERLMRTLHRFRVHGCR